MFVLNPKEYSKVLPILKNIDHNVALVFSVIERNSPGVVYVDNIIEPQSIFIDTLGSFYYLCGREDNVEFNNQVYDTIFREILPKRIEKELILFSYSDEWKDRLDYLLKEKGAIRINRKTFSFNLQKFNPYIGWKNKVPSGYKVERITNELAEKYEQYKPIIDSSSKRFGYCVLKDDEVVSDCIAVCVGGGEAEVGISTNENYRRQGYATLAASAFIEHCLLNGLTPNWACWPYRVESIALARKLGFQDKAGIQAHYWAENM